MIREEVLSLCLFAFEGKLQGASARATIHLTKRRKKTQRSNDNNFIMYYIAIVQLEISHDAFFLDDLGFHQGTKSGGLNIKYVHVYRYHE